MQQLSATNAVPLKRLTATLRDGSQIVWYNAADENKAMAACLADEDVEPVGSVVWPAGVAAISAPSEIIFRQCFALPVASPKPLLFSLGRSSQFRCLYLSPTPGAERIFCVPAGDGEEEEEDGGMGADML